MAGISRVALVLHSLTGLAKDAVEMGFVFSNSHNNGGTGNTEGAIHDFLNHANSNHALNAYLGPSLSGQYDILEYDITAHLDGSVAGSPIFTELGSSMSQSGTTGIPRGVCAVLAYHRDIASLGVLGPVVTEPSTEAAIDQGAPATHSGRSRPRSRAEGRIFVGPLNQTATAQDSTTGRQVVSTALLQDLTDIATRLSTAGVGWAQWSRRNASVGNVLGGWIDHSLHYQRRREEVPGVRSVWP